MDAFDRDGSIVVRGVVPRDEIAGMAAMFSTLIPDSPHYPGGLFEITGAAQSHERLAAIARDRRFGELAARALGARHVQHLQDSLLYKCAGGVVEWHRDHTYVGFLVPARVVALRIALTHETDASGCLRVVDGSHTWGPIDVVRPMAFTDQQHRPAALHRVPAERLPRQLLIVTAKNQHHRPRDRGERGLGAIR